jgi:hypothetical protein
VHKERTEEEGERGKKVSGCDTIKKSMLKSAPKKSKNKNKNKVHLH